MTRRVRSAAGVRRAVAGTVRRPGVAIVAAVIIMGETCGVADALCIECVTLKLEHPVVVRGPSAHEPDAPVSMIELPGGGFRAFAANATTFAIDGASPLALGGKAQAVLEPGPRGSPSECGRWLTTVLPGKRSLFGLIHNERNCHEPGGESFKSMAIGRSEDEGLTWNVLGQIITADQQSIPGQAGGEGDCTMADGHDGYWYAFCLRVRDWKNTVARAPAGDPVPGKWNKWSGNGWNAHGLGGKGAALDEPVGMSSAYWTDARSVLLLGMSASGMQLSLSQDKLHFAMLAAPVILYDANEWKRPAPTDFYAYPSMVAQHGFNDIGGRFYLTYTYIPPGEGFTQRYLVVQEAQIALEATSQRPQVRVALSRWSSADGAKWVTTGPPTAPPRAYGFEAQLGYLMTAPPAEVAAVALDECFSQRSGTGYLAPAGDCSTEGSGRRRAAGYAYRSGQPGTVPIYSCLSPDYTRFTSVRADCDSAGSRDRVLGYALR